MIKRKDLFKKEYIGLLCPHSFEFLNHLIGQLGYSQEQYDNLKVKQNVLNVIKLLFDLGILTVHDWVNNKDLNNENLTSVDIINKIDDLWVKGIKYPDFYNIILFGTSGWYVKKLENLGMTPTTNWETFVKDKIGNLEKWIEDNRPKG